jgi:hypothetical protein
MPFMGVTSTARCHASGNDSGEHGVARRKGGSQSVLKPKLQTRPAYGWLGESVNHTLVSRAIVVAEVIQVSSDRQARVCRSVDARAHEIVRTNQIRFETTKAAGRTGATKACSRRSEMMRGSRSMPLTNLEVPETQRKQLGV